MNGKEALKLAILEYEKDLKFDENNQWVKDVLKGLKKCQQELEKLEVVIEILKDDLYVYEKADYCLSVNGSLEYQKLTKQEYELLKEVLEG